MTGFVATVSGLAPHVLHHIGLLAGVAVVAGTQGTILFGLIGFVVSIPFLLRLRRRFGTWRAPLIGLIVFAALFSLSAFVIGPAISGQGSSSTPTQPIDHSSHH
jgi:predicted PurR-regulated permease PerM